MSFSGPVVFRHGTREPRTAVLERIPLPEIAPKSSDQPLTAHSCKV